MVLGAVALLLSALAGSVPTCTCDCCSVVTDDTGARCTRAVVGVNEYADQPECVDTCVANANASNSFTPTTARVHRAPVSSVTTEQQSHVQVGTDPVSAERRSGTAPRTIRLE